MSNWTGRDAVIAVVLAVVTIAIFRPLGHYDFINFDDPLYVTENPFVSSGLSWRNLHWSFTTSHAANWHPLTWISLMMDAELSAGNDGLAASSFHRTNVLLHAANSALVFLVLLGMTGKRWPSLLVAVLFAIHPLHVESVAWIPERKDVLSTFFGLLAIGAYVRYCARSEWPWFIVSLLFFLLCLLSKQMLVTLPFVLLLFDYWPLGRFDVRGLRLSKTEQPKFHQASWRWLLLEKIPFFVLSVASGLVLVHAQQSGQAIRSLTKYPLEVRLVNVAVSYVRYLWMTVFPNRLAFFYPYDAQPFLWGFVAAVGLVLVTFVCLIWSRRFPFGIVGWFFYLGTLVPVIGIVQVGDQARRDRYTYVPLLGIFIIVAWGLGEILKAWPKAKSTVVGISVVSVLVLTLATVRQIPKWRDSESLYTDAIKVTSNNETAHVQLANHYKATGNYAAAIAQYQNALAIRPNTAEFLANLGGVYLDVGQTEKAMEYFRAAERSNPNLGFVLNNMAWVLATSSKESLRDPEEAVRLAERACAMESPPNLAFVDTLAAAYAAVGRYVDAVNVGNEARQRALGQGLVGFAEDMESRIALYRQGRPYRESESP